MSIITSEFNYQRNSHRIDLPMLVEIDGHAYKAKDWSLLGIGIQDFDKELEKGDKVAARCSLNMPESSISIKVELEFRGLNNGIAGFSFVNLGLKHRRVLRHYMEMAIEGKLDNIEDLVSIVTAPAVETPIEEALTLSDLETESLSHQFKSRSYLVIGLGILFVVILLATIFYNTMYRIQVTGLAVGNLERITANTAGVITRVYVKEDAFVPKNTKLFSVQNVALVKELSIVKAKRQEKEKFLKNLQDDANVNMGAKLLRSLRLQYNQRIKEYEDAKKLFEQRIISFKDFNYIENQLQQSRVNHAREYKAAEVAVKKRLEDIEIIKAEIAGLKKQESAIKRAGAMRQVRSSIAGRIYRIEYEPGAYVVPNDVVIILDKDVKPAVLIRLRDSDALKVRLGTEANIYVPFNDQNYKAKIVAVGYSSINSDATVTMEASLNETLIKLEFEDDTVRLPANSRVKVWIRTF
ncbi:MAG TPA: HlyD family secretion protein [Gammaproteobacteria bacterium]|nr:HlyD family secretion protein [Gammaproteobacteria bacterium]